LLPRGWRLGCSPPQLAPEYGITTAETTASLEARRRRRDSTAINGAMPLEMWGGLECTINRVREIYFRQMERNGHLWRLSDIDLFAGLGIRAIRYPVLWEQFVPRLDDRSHKIDWTWADERLGRLRELGVRPIVGLVHHGSGPPDTSLVEPSFATGLARFARQVAERYPWVDAYTPVNEPLTTARFSGLYGVWYPHGRSHRTFARALLNQCRAVVLAMAEIRAVNPEAQLIQTEDLGRIYSTPGLAYQAAFENERRWLSFDLLCGLVDSDHPLRSRLRRWGVTDSELAEFRKAPCPPNILGINHYLTSDRFLDEDREKYPERARSHNRNELYADIEAVRACGDCHVGVCVRLREAWDRYHLPLAVTESHLGSTREEQLRWLNEAWGAARELRREGIDVRAVTAWSLLGAFDWNTLVTRERGFYEPGVFDVRGPRPRRTALAGLVTTLASGAKPNHPVLAQPGWWRRPDRICWPAAEGRSYAQPTGPSHDMRDRSTRPLAIVGATGTLGSAFARLCDVRGIPYHVLTRSEVDITDPKSVDEMLDITSPWALVNCAGYVRVDEAERNPDECFRTNVTGPAVLASGCTRHGVELLTFSSDLVFDGLARSPYTEDDMPAPLSVYGKSKMEMEQRVREILPRALVVRTSAFFGPWDEHNFVTASLRALRAGRTIRVLGDVTISPTYIVDLVHAALDLLIDDEHGIWHLANEGVLTWAMLARRAARSAGVTTGKIDAIPMHRFDCLAQRPKYSALASIRGRLLPSLNDALLRYTQHRELVRRSASPDGRERRRRYRPWKYDHAQAWA
jgi:dTDP-4-dehydrorhamnose reductase